ncbi:MAG: tetratricopeptide repeat protein, partial [Armatimonadota bacterium]|nr:tetratricopeptide repeat protein [Armatimonadota bacterium]
MTKIGNLELESDEIAALYMNAIELAKQGNSLEAFQSMNSAVMLTVDVPDTMWWRYAQISMSAVRQIGGPKNNPAAKEVLSHLHSAIQLACRVLLSHDPDAHGALFFRAQSLILSHASGIKADLEQAKQDLEHLHQLHPDDEGVNGLLKLLPSAIEDEQYDKAIEWFNKGNALQNQERWREAAEAFREAVRIKPDWGEAYDRLASMHAQLEEYETAIEMCKTALRFKPTDADLYYNLASNYAQIDKDEEAVEAYRRCIQLAPQDVDAYYYLNTCLGRLGREEEAIAVLQKAHEIDPSNVKVLHALQAKLTLMGRPMR